MVGGLSGPIGAAGRARWVLVNDALLRVRVRCGASHFFFSEISNEQQEKT